ncbi:MULTISPECIES: hypothetical protein [unclassified Adlercreutzia]|uniref:hypothetical protein n=1 Tax=unclassified Adlercreutzia TaxID=2636013 RepID=UPI0013EAA083|nr:MULTISPECIES: hypothetical protein [unclassified Adlercreutzia]
MTEMRRGTRCTPCRGCGRCFMAADADSFVAEAGAHAASDPVAEAGARFTCGAGAEGKAHAASGLEAEAGSHAASGLEDVDASTGATSFADAARKLDRGAALAPPAMPAAPGAAPGAAPAEASLGSASAPEAAAPKATQRARSPFATLKAADGEVDASTGATPGVSAACREFGMGDSAAFAASRGIKPPGQA